MNNFDDIYILTLKLLTSGLGFPLISLFIIGFITAFLQAITQIQDQILSFLPKIVFLFVTIYFSFSLYFETLVELFKLSLEL